jgi:5-methylcytosine-specific restriction endonuclease McrA
MFHCVYCQVKVKALDCSGCDQCEDTYPDNFYKFNGKGAWTERKEKVYQKTGGLCWLCKNPLSKKNFTFDHILPKSLGGKNNLENLMPAHKKCNGRRGSQLIVETTHTL